jgi:predicted DNA-binding transcriptional regulator YafY
VPERANSPATKRERLLELLASRTQAHPRWTTPELAEVLCCSERTVERYLDWLRQTGRLPLPLL